MYETQVVETPCAPRWRKHVALLAALGSLSTCGGGDAADDPCAPEFDAPTDVRSVVPTGPLPGWAIGDFAVHDIDIHNFRILDSGEVQQGLLGGDYGGCSTMRAARVGDRVVLHSRLRPNEPDAVLAVDDGGTVFLHWAQRDADCEWVRLQRGTLCGVDVGGCGGFGDSEPCDWSRGGCGSEEGVTPDGGVAGD